MSFKYSRSATYSWTAILFIVIAFGTVVVLTAGLLALVAFVLSWAFGLVASGLGITATLTFWPAFGLVVFIYLVRLVLGVGGGSKS